jgi:hypothetical protein
MKSSGIDEMLTMDIEDYPYLFQKSDKSSSISQKNHGRIIFCDFILMFLASVLSSVPICTIDVALPIRKFVLLLLFVSIILKLCSQVLKWDSKWFDSRAVAESVKTATWRYIMGAEPYNLVLPKKDIDKRFNEELNDILESRPEAQKCLSLSLSNGKQISDKMNDIRSLTLYERKDIYLNKRIKEQKIWYQIKANTNNKIGIRWFFAIIGTQVFAMCVLTYILNKPVGTYNPVSVFMTLASMFIAWTQIKRHRELEQSYSLASQDIASAESLMSHVNSDIEFSKYIDDTENAISREHTMWIAKRS